MSHSQAVILLKNTTGTVQLQVRHTPAFASHLFLSPSACTVTSPKTALHNLCLHKPRRRPREAAESFKGFAFTHTDLLFILHEPEGGGRRRHHSDGPSTGAPSWSFDTKLHFPGRPWVRKHVLLSPHEGSVWLYVCIDKLDCLAGTFHRMFDKYYHHVVMRAFSFNVLITINQSNNHNASRR